MKNFLILSLLVLFSIQLGCSNNRDYSTEAAREPVTTNADLGEQVKKEIDRDPRLEGAHINVDADASRNLVTLTGTVDTEAQRNSAVQLAKNAHPGVAVNNQIKVEPDDRNVSRTDWTEEHAARARDKAKGYGDTIGSSLDDAWIHTKITTKLIGDTGTSARHINVDVNNNTVTLRGTVDSASEKAEVERLAKETDGVRSVNNQLKVQ
jgi:hyperosmotically inducible periplasmic protein